MARVKIPDYKGFIGPKRERFEKLALQKGGTDWGKNPGYCIKGCLTVKHIERPGRGSGKGKARMATVGCTGRFYNPAALLSFQIADALDPAKVPGRGRTLSDMSDEEKRILQEKYGAKISQKRT